MLSEATTAGVYHSPGWNKDYAKIQIVTVAQLLKGARVEMPQHAAITFKQAQAVQDTSMGQTPLDL